jgi:hypothetical protein
MAARAVNVSDATAENGAKGDPQGANFVFALGRVEPRPPDISIEKELAHAIGREQTSGLTDRQALHATMATRENRYLARQVCWVFAVEGLDTYLLQPRDPADFEMLVETIRPRSSALDLDLVIGRRLGLAPAELCGGLSLSLVVFDHAYSFDTETLVAAIPRPDGADESQFSATAHELLARVMQIADNAGATDEHRALNYVAVREAGIYSRLFTAHNSGQSLTAVETRRSRLSISRKIVNVILSFTDRQSDTTEKWFTRVDVTDEFPFIATKLAPYYDRN